MFNIKEYFKSNWRKLLLWLANFLENQAVSIILNQMDTNKDGSISRQELKDYMKKHTDKILKKIEQIEG